jgi:hypothetical protein
MDLNQQNITDLIGKKIKVDITTNSVYNISCHT